MLIVRAVRVVGVTAALAVSAAVTFVSPGPTPAAAAGPGLDVTPVLTSAPFAAQPGQQVTHTLTLSGTGTGTLTATRVTFTTTVELDGVTAAASAGSCPVVTPLTVVCDLGNVDFADGVATTAPKVTITGTVHSGTAPGTLVQNLVNVTAAASDADPSNNVASNAYLVPGGNAAAAASTSSSAKARSADSGDGGVPWLPVIAVLVLVVLAAIAFVAVRRRAASADGDDANGNAADGDNGDGNATNPDDANGAEQTPGAGAGDRGV